LLLQIERIRKTFAGRRVLDDLSLTVDRGETVVVTGPSGSGKTTLLRCINGLESPDAGTVRVDGYTLGNGLPNRDRDLLAIRRRVGFVFQQWNLFANRTALQNVIEAPIHVSGLSRATATTRALGLLDRVGVGHRADAYPDELSGGEQQRAAIARALAMEPKVLLLDEPTSALDAARVEDLMALLREIRGDGNNALTLIVVSHDARVPVGLGGRLVTLAAGRIASDGPISAGTSDRPGQSGSNPD
jgi:polar amino acid transport system ATP-binding protein